MKHVYFSNSEFTVIHTQDIHKNIHTISLEFIVHIHNMRNSIVKYFIHNNIHSIGQKYNIHNIDHQYSRSFQVYQ
jgi:hypothetical protein